MSLKCSHPACKSLGEPHPFCEFIQAQEKQPEYVLYGYATPSGELYASGIDALSNGEQSWVKVYVNKEDLK